MRVASVLCFLVAGLLGIGSVVHVQKPSLYPLVTVVGAFVVPLLFAWWGWLLWGRANAMSAQPHDVSSNGVTHRQSRRLTLVALASALGITGLVVWYVRADSPSGPPAQAMAVEGGGRELVGGKREATVPGSIPVASTCPVNARLVSIPQMRERYPQYDAYSDLELATALVQLCYPAEQPERLAQRLNEFHAKGPYSR